MIVNILLIRIKFSLGPYLSAFSVGFDDLHITVEYAVLESSAFLSNDFGCVTV